MEWWVFCKPCVVHKHTGVWCYINVGNWSFVSNMATHDQYSANSWKTAGLAFLLRLSRWAASIQCAQRSQCVMPSRLCEVYTRGGQMQSCGPVTVSRSARRSGRPSLGFTWNPARSPFNMREHVASSQDISVQDRLTEYHGSLPVDAMGRYYEWYELKLWLAMRATTLEVSLRIQNLSMYPRTNQDESSVKSGLTSTLLRQQAQLYDVARQQSVLFVLWSLVTVNHTGRCYRSEQDVSRSPSTGDGRLNRPSTNRSMYKPGSMMASVAVSACDLIKKLCIWGAAGILRRQRWTTSRASSNTQQRQGTIHLSRRQISLKTPTLKDCTKGLTIRQTSPGQVARPIQGVE
jgi:hypothetical protein